MDLFVISPKAKCFSRRFSHRAYVKSQVVKDEMDNSKLMRGVLKCKRQVRYSKELTYLVS